MRSMTSYGQYEVQSPEWTASIEIRTLNSRFLEISPVIPSYLRSLEQDIRDLAAKHFLRGKIEIFVHVKEHNIPVAVGVNTHIVDELLKIYADYATEMEKLSFPTLVELGALSVEPLREKEAYRTVLDGIEKAITICQAMREKEGLAIEKSLRTLSERLGERLDLLKARIPGLAPRIQADMLSRFEELLGDKMDTQRAYAEIAVQVSKASIQEEVERMTEHLAHFASSLHTRGVLGKHLDFLCQEMNREVNTMLSKLPVAELQLETITMKGMIEDLREQMRNVE